MEKEIKQGLVALEQKHGVRVLYACESGSRAWGFASPDSDYDIRFIYAYPRALYLELDEPRDTLELMEGDLDYSGWDIRKALRLLRTTNPALLEWLSSPIIYRNRGTLRNELADLSARYHAPIAIHWHYLKMARSNFAQCIRNPAERGENVLTKKYLYVMNPLIKLLFFERHHILSPLNFEEALQQIIVPDVVQTAITELLILKRSGMEIGRGPADPAVNVWIEQDFARLQEAVPLPTKHTELTPLLNAVLAKVLAR